MLAALEDIVGRCQKVEIRDAYASFFECFANRASFPGFAKLEVAAGYAPRIDAMWAFAPADEELAVAPHEHGNADANS